MPEVSVVISVLNPGPDLSSTIMSVLDQSLSDIEIILIDDGSTAEERINIINVSSKDERIKVLTNKVNIGLTKSLIIGCKSAASDFIARIDSGDLMVPSTRLAEQSKILMKRKELVLVAGALGIIDTLNFDYYKSSENENIFYTGEDLEKNANSVFKHVTVMFKKHAYLQAGGYNPDVLVGQDSDLWPRLLAQGGGVVMSNVYAIATMNPHSISVKNNNKQILGKIDRIRKSSKNSATKLLLVAIEHIKILLPIKYRVKLRYRKNFIFVRKIKESECRSLKRIKKWVEDE